MLQRHLLSSFSLKYLANNWSSLRPELFAKVSLTCLLDNSTHSFSHFFDIAMKPCSDNTILVALALLLQKTIQNLMVLYYNGILLDVRYHLLSILLFLPMYQLLKVGDFGCGEAKIMEILGYERVYSCDHIAINEKVTACDMKSVPLPDGSLDVIVFSLSLMGKNWVDYILEARRCLWNYGLLLIAETTNALSEGRLSDLRHVLNMHGFKILKEEERDVFTFIEARKETITS
jgi:putative methyltransferase